MGRRETMENDFESFAIKYFGYSREQLLLELDARASRVHYLMAPSEEERVASGNALWLQFKRQLAFQICGNDKKGTRKKITKILDSGIIAFISQVGPIILGSGITPGITVGVAATLAALLANDLLENGIENFCKTCLMDL